MAPGEIVLDKVDVVFDIVRCPKQGQVGMQDGKGTAGPETGRVILPAMSS